MRAALAFCILLLAGASLGAFVFLQTPGDVREQQVVDVSAERFSFTPSEIRTRVGTTLRLQLRSQDTDHGFRILGTDLNVEIPKRGRGTITVDFTPDRAGRYTFECSHVCGAGHSFMRGEIVVLERQAEQR
ncbi:MAG TPA: cupredoxin domain-containing protein [Vicinamibacterales bacterium]|jgi:cytochrome c oxidase subunit 2|nr:cupredoxin domain-containing protein [Vicinamibacterales bacterium]